jgi:Helix-destabilising protein
VIFILIKFTITSTELRNHRGVSKSNQKPFDMYFQTAWAHTTDKSGAPHPYPQRVEIMLQKNQQGEPVPYAQGEYQPSPASFFVDKFMNMGFRPVLIPIRKPA